MHARATRPNVYPHERKPGNRSPITPHDPYRNVNEPKNSASRSASRRGHSPGTVRWTNSRKEKKTAATATGFHSSSDIAGESPSAVSPPEITTAGWK